jgi:transcriptional regulator with XRE-family HTH domain
MPKPRHKRDLPSKDFKQTLAYRDGLVRLGRRLRALRTKRGWTLEQAEENLAFDWKHLGKLETGKLNVTVGTLLRLAAGYGVDLQIRLVKK